MRNVEQSLAAVADIPLEPVEKLELAFIIQDYVLGFIASDLNPDPAARDTIVPAVARYIAQQLQTGSFPHALVLFGKPEPEAVLRQLTSEASNDKRFEAGLTRVLDGIALYLQSLTGSRSNAPGV
jgi:hypothetical protein